MNKYIIVKTPSGALGVIADEGDDSWDEADEAARNGELVVLGGAEAPSASRAMEMWCSE